MAGPRPERRTSSPLRKLFAKNVRLARINAGWSQEQLADECEFDRTVIGSLERGKRNISIDNISRIADVLAIPPHELLSPSLAADRGFDETLRRAPRTSRGPARRTLAGAQDA